MSSPSYPTEQLALIVNNWGLGLAIEEHDIADRIEDPAIANQWRIARDAIAKLGKLIPDHECEEEDEFDDDDDDDDMDLDDEEDEDF